MIWNRTDRLGAHVPRGLMGMLVLVCAVEALVGRSVGEYTPFFTLDWPVTGRAAREKAPGCEVLCFGDSLVKFGILPRVLEHRLGSPAYNLAVCGGQAPASYFLLRRALEAGARPRAIVIDLMPHLLDHSPRHSIRQWPELLSLREFIELCGELGSGSFLATTALGEVLPSVRARFELREAVLSALRGQPAALRPGIAQYQQNWEQNRGAHVVPKRPHVESRVYRLERWEDFSRRWSCHRTNAEFLRRLLKLARQNEIRVYWLLPPVRPDSQRRREQIGIDRQYTAFIQRMTREFPELCVIDGRHAGYDERLFADPLHLDPAGALALSEGVAEVLASHAAGASDQGPWCPLPDVRNSEISLNARVAEPSRLAIQLSPRRP